MGRSVTERFSDRLGGLSESLGKVREWWSEIANSRVFAYLRGGHPLCMRYPDGRCLIFRAGRLAASTNCRFDRARYRAVMVPDSLVLERDIPIPPSLTHDQLLEMLAFDVFSNSPFPEDDTVWGYAPQGRGRVHLTIASRTHLGVWLEKQAIGDVERLEVWAGSARPVRLRGLGSERRMLSERRWAQANVVALIALVGVLCLAAVLPVYQKWSELKLYERASDRLAGQSSEIVQAREELGHAVARIDAAGQWFGEPVAPAWLLPRLTELLPDHTMVERMEVDGGRVSLQGQSENAGALPAILGREPRFRDIRMPRAISRDARTGRERYVIEFSIDSEERS